MKILNNNTHSYNEIRSILLFGKNNSIVYKSDIFDLFNKLKHRLTGIGYTQFLKGFFYSLFDQKTPAHFFNTVCLSSNDWIVTYETSLPRLGDANKIWIDVGVKRLHRKNCKKIIAISQCAYDLQVSFLKKKYPQFLLGIQKKMIVMHPPQQLLINKYEDKKLPAAFIVFTIIGSDFFRKGGRELLNVMNELIPNYPNIKLNIVSSLVYGDYASKTTINDKVKSEEIIAKYPDNIIFHNSLPNHQVLELLKETHVGLLPTWGDTYGYSVLEAQAAGCPVITTNLRALPEINNHSIGWLIDVPLNESKDADIETLEKRIIFQNVLEEGLKSALISILHNPQQIHSKGINCIEKIRSCNSLTDYYNKIQQIYNEEFY